MPKDTVKFIDLFSGMGGIRIGFEQAFKKAGYKTKCVLTSEIKDAAIRAHKINFPGEKIEGDVTQIKTSDIEDFDFLLAGFPCQAFSVAGKQRGFADTRGTLFFEVERILREKQPYGFLLENVEGLVTHDRENAKDPIGRTLSTIIHSLETMGYHVSWKVLNAKNFGLPQVRNRIYIVGTKADVISLDNFKEKSKSFGRVQEKNLPVIDDEFTRALLNLYQPHELYGKSIKDKRGGENNIHSWDLGIRGETTEQERSLLNRLLKERRKKHWAEVIGIDWMDGMPLTAEQIRTFYDSDQLDEILSNLIKMGYLVYEHPKKKVVITHSDGRTSTERVPDETKEKGYNIVTGKLSFEFSQILDPLTTTPNPFAVAESISLHKACHNAIYLERSFNAAHFLQSKDRIHRYGLKQDVVTNYYYLVSEDSVDTTIHERLNEKERRLLDIIESMPIPLFDNYMNADEDDDIKAVLRDYARRTKTI